MTQTSDLPSLLSAASLLFGVITFLYGLSYRELSTAAALRVAGRQKDDLGPQRERVRRARVTAMFVAVVAAVVGLIFTPDAARLSRHAPRRGGALRADARDVDVCTGWELAGGRLGRFLHA